MCCYFELHLLIMHLHMQVFYTTAWYLTWYRKSDKLQRQLSLEEVNSLSPGWALALEMTIQQLFPKHAFAWPVRGTTPREQTPDYAIVPLPASLQELRAKWLGLLGSACGMMIALAHHEEYMHIRKLTAKQLNYLMKWCKQWQGTSLDVSEKWKKLGKWL